MSFAEQKHNEVSAPQFSDDARTVVSDSGYGGSEGVPEYGGEVLNANASEHDRRQWASNVQQLHYNQNRVALGRSINRVIETLKVWWCF